MDIIADTTAGKIEGRQKDGVMLFAGIPYAAAPTGARRFRPPEAARPWAGVREAKRFGPVAPQGGDPASVLTRGWEPETSEDCLTLNVQTSALDDGRRPVMVWIHGGGFTSGTGAIPWYNGESFVRTGDVVVATINYRLGALGFLYLAHRDPDYPEAANLGILDQVAALEWVRDNIAGFGGDPDNVTIFGESAGGMSVATLLGTPRAGGLFHKAIPQSGTAQFARPVETAAEITDHLLDVAGCATVAELSALSVDEVLAAQNRVVGEFAASADGQRKGAGIGLPFFPVVDGTVVPEHPLEATRQGLSAEVPLLTGTTRDEFNLFLLARPGDFTWERVRRWVSRLHPDPDRVIDTYREAVPERSPREAASAFMTAWTFGLPAIRLAEAQGRHQPDHTFVYQFRWASDAFDGALGSCHALEIPFAFNNLDKRGTEFLLGSTPPTSLATTMHRSWIAFAHAGDPRHEGFDDWLPYQPDRTVARLDEVCSVVADPDAAERELFDGVL